MSGPSIIDLPDDDELLLAALETVRAGVLAHPIAARALFAALVREGQRHAQTEPGRSLASRLARSARFARARQTWKATTSWLLEGASEDGALPSTLFDALVTTAGSDHLPELLEESALRQGRK